MGAVKNPSRTTQDLERGWTVGNATPTREEPSHYIPGSPAVASVAPPYSPSRPDMISSITVNQVFVKEDCVKVDITHENSYFVANFNSEVKKDTNILRNIQATIVNTRPRPQGTTTAKKGTLYQVLYERISSETKVGKVFIDHIHMITPTPVRLPLTSPTMTAQQSPQPSETLRTPAIPSPMQSHQLPATLPTPTIASQCRVASHQHLYHRLLPYRLPEHQPSRPESFSPMESCPLFPLPDETGMPMKWWIWVEGEPPKNGLQAVGAHSPRTGSCRCLSMHLPCWTPTWQGSMWRTEQISWTSLTFWHFPDQRDLRQHLRPECFLEIINSYGPSLWVRTHSWEFWKC